MYNIHIQFGWKILIPALVHCEKSTCWMIMSTQWWGHLQAKVFRQKLWLVTTYCAYMKTATCSLSLSAYIKIKPNTESNQLRMNMDLDGTYRYVKVTCGPSLPLAAHGLSWFYQSVSTKKQVEGRPFNLTAIHVHMVSILPIPVRQLQAAKFPKLKLYHPNHQCNLHRAVWQVPTSNFISGHSSILTCACWTFGSF